MILINAKREWNVLYHNFWYGLLVILINAKHSSLDFGSTSGYGLLVILINAKHIDTNIINILRYGLLVILINAKPSLCCFRLPVDTDSWWFWLMLNSHPLSNDLNLDTDSWWFWLMLNLFSPLKYMSTRYGLLVILINAKLLVSITY